MSRTSKPRIEARTRCLDARASEPVDTAARPTGERVTGGLEKCSMIANGSHSPVRVWVYACVLVALVVCFGQSFCLVCPASSV